MIDEKVLGEIRSNSNTGVEYEIALFRCLLPDISQVNKVDLAIADRWDSQTVRSIIRSTSTSDITRELNRRSLSLCDVSFETQNDDVGPSDIVIYVKDTSGIPQKIGISVKYSNTCTLNATGRKFLTERQISHLKNLLGTYTDEYISEMSRTYGSVNNWFRLRKPSVTTDRYIDLIRDEVISNWSVKSDADKILVLSEAYQETSPIPYWVFTYTSSSYTLDTHPYKIARSAYLIWQFCMDAYPKYMKRMCR